MNVADIKIDPADNGKRLAAQAMSYARFSSVRQGRGDSIRRQEEKENKFESDTGIPIVERLRDLGLSASKGTHVRRGDLGDFLDLIKTPEFQKKTKVRDIYLLVENLDRLSRQKVSVAMNQLSAICSAGVKVVTLMDQRVYDSETIDKDIGSLIVSITIMWRAYEEIESRRDKLKSAWEKKRQRAEAGEIISPCHFPRWLKLSADGKKFVKLPKVVAIVRRVFELAASGMPATTIAKKLNAENIPSLNFYKTGKVSYWSHCPVKRLIESKSVLGILALYKQVDNADGTQRREFVRDVPGYYPQIITPEQRAKALKVLTNGKSNRGKTSGACWNLFRKIAFDSQEDLPIYVNANQNGHWWYLPKNVRMGARKGASWHGPQLETIFFSTVQRAMDVEGSLASENDDLVLPFSESNAATSRASVKKSVSGSLPVPVAVVSQSMRKIVRCCKERSAQTSKESRWIATTGSSRSNC